MNELHNNNIRCAVATKALLRVQFLQTFCGGRGEEQEASVLLSKKGGKGSKESQQKFDFFSYDDMPNLQDIGT